MSLASPSIVAPTRLRLPDLLHTTDSAADDVLSGHYDHLLPAGGVPIDERWFTRLHGDDELDVWLISWVPDKSTELHDHGGSLGALTVVSGALAETRWAANRLRTPPVDRGRSGGFPAGLGTRRGVGAGADAHCRSCSRCRRPGGSDAERARVLAAADRDVVLRSDRTEHSAS